MHKVAIYRRYAYQSQASVVFCADHFKTIHHVNKLEIVFHNLKILSEVKRSLLIRISEFPVNIHNFRPI